MLPVLFMKNKITKYFEIPNFYYLSSSKMSKTQKKKIFTIMKKFKQFLLLGLIFALVSSVSYAAPPGKATLTEFIENDEPVFIDQAITPAITLKISTAAFDDLRQHRAESVSYYTYIIENLSSMPPGNNNLSYGPPFNLYGENDKSYINIKTPVKNAIKCYPAFRKTDFKHKNPLPLTICNKRE
jgi:hypothetical protein